MRLSIAGAVLIFIIGMLSLPQVREIINLIPSINLSDKAIASSHWQAYLLLFIPTTLMAVLSITLWVTGLRFSAQIYGGNPNEENTGSGNGGNNEALTECIKAFGDAIKQSSGG